MISDESFWPRQWVPSLKLRAAVGSSGKAPGAFDAVRTWDPVAAENGKPAFAPNQIGNPDLGPERSQETEVGFDLAALDGRINVAYTHFSQQTKDALIPVIQAPSLGFSSSQLENVGTLENSGNEVTGHQSERKGGAGLCGVRLHRLGLRHAHLQCDADAADVQARDARGAR